VDAKRHAEEWVAYYGTPDTQCAEDWWIRGLETARAWLRLATCDSASQQEVSSLLATAKANQRKGSGWYFMARSIYSWAKEVGHDVPPPEDFFDSQGKGGSRSWRKGGLSR